MLHTTGEGGVSPYHLNGGDLVWQIGTGYFGCRNDDGTFSLSRLIDRVAATPSIRAIELKLSQGAKPGLGGMFPVSTGHPRDRRHARYPGGGRTARAPPVTPPSVTSTGCSSWWRPSAPRQVCPSASSPQSGRGHSVDRAAERMARTGRGVDFVTVDGGEGGTAQRRLVFSDHVALPFKWAFPRVYRAFAEQGLHHDVVFIGSGKPGVPENALLAMAMGCDYQRGRATAMFSIGCIQAQRCHTGRCPSGVATRVASGWDTARPGSKSVRCAHYLATVRFELLSLAGPPPAPPGPRAPQRHRTSRRRPPNGAGR